MNIKKRCRALMIAVFLLSALITSPAAAAQDVSLELAQETKERVDQAAVSLKNGLQKFGEKIGEAGPKIYKIKTKIESYVKAGTWDSLPKGEKAVLVASALKYVGELEQAFSSNMEEMLRGMEAYERTVGDSMVAVSVVKSANKDGDYFLKNQTRKIKQAIEDKKNTPQVQNAIRILRSSRCKNKNSDMECLEAKQAVLQFRRELKFATSEIKSLKQQKKLVDMNNKLTQNILGRLKSDGPYASRTFRQVVETWVDLSRNLELLRNMPSDSIVGGQGLNQTEKIIKMGENMEFLSKDMVNMLEGIVDSVIGNLGNISEVSLSGGTDSTEDILNNLDSATENFARLTE